MASSEKSLFEKLNNTNYRAWALKMKMVLIKEDLWSAIELKDGWENEDDNNENKVKLQKALANIVLMVGTDQLVHVSSAKDGKEAWNKLKDFHQSNTQRHRIRLMSNLFKMKLAPRGNMMTHLQKFFEIIEELREMEINFDEAVYISAMMASMGNEYDNLITGIETWEEKRLTLNAVKSQLIEEWKKKCESQDEPVTSKVSFANFECYFCHEKGHIKRNCMKFKQAMMNKASGSSVESAETARFDKRYSNSFNINKDSKWLVDSGASAHITYDIRNFSNLDRLKQGHVVVASGSRIPYKGVGNVEIAVSCEEGTRRITLSDVLWVPSINGNLVSVYKLIEMGFAVVFTSSGCFLEQDGERLLIADKSRDLYTVNTVDSFAYAVNKRKSLCVHEWHLKLAHRNLQDVLAMKKKGLMIRDCECESICESCIKGKISRNPFPAKATPTNDVLDCIVSDICGPIQVTSVGGERYFATFIDVHSRYSEVYFLRTKDEVEDKIVEYLELLKNTFGRKVKVFRSDRGTEYLSNRVQSYLKKEGIKFQCTVAYSPQQNGIAERKNRTLVEACRAMLSQSGLPKCFWSEAILNANFTLNRMLSKGMNKTPFEKFFDKDQKSFEFHEFGCSVYAMIPQQKRQKLDDKANKCAFMGYDSSSKGFRVADVNRRKVFVSRDLVFLNERYMSGHVEQTENDDDDTFMILLNGYTNETNDRDNGNVDGNRDNADENDEIFYDAVQGEGADIAEENLILDENQIQEENGNVEANEHHEEEIVIVPEQNEEAVEEDEEEEIVLRRSTRRRQNPSYLDDYVVYSINEQDVYEPKTYAEATRCKSADKWKQAMNEEIQSIQLNDTWKLVDLPKNKQAIGCKWVYKLKLDDKGNVSRYKARLVAKGFSQKYGQDYDEVFAPVARSTTFRILMSIAGVRQYHVKHFDVKTAFLNGNIEEEIYMKQPPGFQIGSKVCKLNKGLYGLKQAARAWNKTFHDTLVEYGFLQNDIDKCLYTLRRNNDICYVIIHVDDILIASDNSSLINDIGKFIGNKFELKDLGEVKHFLGIDVQKDKDGNFVISQSQYIEKIVDEAGLKDAKISKYPLMTGYFRHDDCEELESNEEYRKLIGMLLYLSTNTRPDIAASVAILSQRIAHPTKTDLNEVKRIIRYLKDTKTLKLRLSDLNCLKDLHIFSDASWAEDNIDRKSNSGYYCSLNGGAISWCSRKQDIVSLSSTEAEYIALTECCKELTWIRMVCKQFDIDVPNAVDVLTDSQSSMKLIKNQKFSNRTKHIDTKYHYVRQLADSGDIALKYCQTDVNIADMLTKPLGSTKIKQLRALAGLDYHEAKTLS